MKSGSLFRCFARIMVHFAGTAGSAASARFAYYAVFMICAVPRPVKHRNYLRPDQSRMEDTVLWSCQVSNTRDFHPGFGTCPSYEKGTAAFAAVPENRICISYFMYRSYAAWYTASTSARPILLICAT